MNFIRNIYNRFFGQNSAEDEHSEEEVRPKRRHSQELYEAEIQRALEESKREQEERENAKKYHLDPEEAEQIEAIQYEEIHSVVYNQEELSKILKKLPGVNPDDEIFNEFYDNEDDFGH